MDDSVFHRLYEKYHHDIFRFLIYLTRSREQSEDLVHEVYVRVLKSYKGFKGESSEKTWLFSIAKNVAIDFFRKQSTRRKHAMEHFDWEKSELAGSQTLPDEFITMNEQMQELLNALETCTGDQKLVIQMRYLHDLSISETAAILDWTESKVKTTQHRAIKALQKKLTALPQERGNEHGEKEVGRGEY